MQIRDHSDFELRHATIPTYFVSYLFPLLFIAYEIYRVGYWVARHGWHFVAYSQGGYEFTLMLAMFVVQVVLEVVFFFGAWMSRHPDLEHRFANLALGILCSAAVLAFDFGLQSGF